MKIKTVIMREDDGSYSLFVNGRQFLDRESLTICENVRDSISMYPRLPGETVTECDELAANIVKVVSR